MTSKVTFKTVFAGRLNVKDGDPITIEADRPYDLLCQLEREAAKLDAEGKHFTIATWRFKKRAEEDA